MNLGAVYINTVYEIAFYVALATLLIAIVVRYRFSVRKRVLIPAALLGFFPAAYVCLVLFHQDLFTIRHRSQNDRIPDVAYVSYRPNFKALRAVGPMTEPDLEQWLSESASIGLAETSPPSPFLHDVEYFGADGFDRAFATQSNARGGKYRLYWKSGNIYVAYDAF